MPEDDSSDDGSVPGERWAALAGSRDMAIALAERLQSEREAPVACPSTRCPIVLS
jgi:hypothetical protein